MVLGGTEEKKNGECWSTGVDDRALSAFVLTMIRSREASNFFLRKQSSLPFGKKREIMMVVGENEE